MPEKSDRGWRSCVVDAHDSFFRSPLFLPGWCVVAGILLLIGAVICPPEWREQQLEQAYNICMSHIDRTEGNYALGYRDACQRVELKWRASGIPWRIRDQEIAADKAARAIVERAAAE